MNVTHWGRSTHICLVNLTMIGSDNGLSAGRCQTIIWTKARILLIEPLATNLCEIVIEICTFSCSWNCRLENTVILSRPNVLTINGIPFLRALCTRYPTVIACQEHTGVITARNLMLLRPEMQGFGSWIVLCAVYHLIFLWTKRPPFRRRYFQMHFRESKISHFD